MLARSLASIAAIVAITFLGKAVLPVNAATIGFAYILVVLILATIWGLAEASLASAVATLAFNYYFLPPVGTLTIADPDNWVALFSLLLTSLIASRLSTNVKRRAAEALERQADLESLYSFSRSILLIDGQPFARELVQKLADVFGFEAVVLYDKRSGEFFRGGRAEFEGLEDQLRDTAIHGSSSTDRTGSRVITAVRLGSAPIASIALQGSRSRQDSVVQGIANLVAIGMERARAQELGHEMEAARRSEQLRTTLIDAMAHEFKTPLTSIKAATSALLADAPKQSEELLRVADEEADHLRELIDDAIETARLESTHIDLSFEHSDLAWIVREAMAFIKDRDVTIECSGDVRTQLDTRLAKLAVKQVIENARKYSPPDQPIRILVDGSDATIDVTVIDFGPGIPVAEQSRIFERFFRGDPWKSRVAGSGLGLSIARSILRAHGGEITVQSRPGETRFQMRFPRR